MHCKNNHLKIPIYSFFTGGGFLDMGFEKAGFDIIFTNEIDKDFARFYSEGMSNWAGEAKKISSTDSIEHLAVDEIKNIVGNKEFGIIGGPPCQDFSIRGSKEGFEGIRGTLTFQFYEKIMDLKPMFFLMENVPGLVHLKKTKKYFYELLNLFSEEYFISEKKLNSLHYGVPQSRERLFILGMRKDKFTNSKIHLSENDWFTWPIEKNPNAEKLYKWGEPFSKRKELDLPSPPHQLCVASILVDPKEIDNVPNTDEYFNIQDINKIKKIEEGDTYRPSFKKLHRNKYSPTACYGNNEVHLHPTLNRRLSVREALRIQGVPDAYSIKTSGKLSKKFKMIGNGVPVPLAHHIASAIKSFLFSHLSNGENVDGYLVREEQEC